MAGSGKMLLAIGLAACTHASIAEPPRVSVPASVEVVSEVRSSTVMHDPAPPPARPSVPLLQLQCGFPQEVCAKDDVECYFRSRTACATPLVVAFDTIELVPPDDARFAFTPGRPVRSAWPTAATPWIALDRDGDGAITSGTELFGDSTAGARDGFEAIAQLDDNHDGVVDRRDPAFAALRLWRDDGDRVSQPHELRPLAAEIDAISLAHDGPRGGARLPDGRAVDVIDLYLRTW